jgi:molybdopterin-guanine dinucleotide biosynthesis protein A
MRSVIVIPARWGSTRFPGKPLAPIAGVSLIQRVYDRARASTRASAVYVATDDERIFGHVLEFGGKAVRPEGDFTTGTDRIAAALPLIEDLEGAPFDIIVNVQGDEPLIDISSVDALIERLETTPSGMATLACPLESEDEFHARDVVKVVTDALGNAISPGRPSDRERSPSGTSVSTPTAAPSWSVSWPSSPPPWSAPNHWNSCGRFNTALELRCREQRSRTWESTVPRTWHASRVNLEKRMFERMFDDGACE